MNFQRACTHVLYILVILACLGDFKHIIKAEEHCYRGDGLLDYENPCFGDSPEEPEELGLCTKGQRLTKNCTEVCRYCEPGTYQNTHTNCTSCLKCTTDCTPGQVIQNCTAESDTVCGCPSSPPCPACPTCSACPSCPNVTCPFVTACPSVTPCPAQPENHKNGADPLVDNNFASCQHCCIPLIVVLVIAFVAAAGAFVGYFMYYKPRFKRLRDAKSKDIPMEENKSRMESDKAGSRSREDIVEEGSNRPSKQTSTREEDQGGSSSRLAPLANLKEDNELEDVKVEGGNEEGSGSAEPSEGTDETDIKTPLLDKEEDKSKQTQKGLQKSPTPGNSSEPDQTIEADGVSEDKLCSKKEEKPNSQELERKLQEQEEKLQKSVTELKQKQTRIDDLEHQLAVKDHKVATPKDDPQKKNTEVQELKKQVEELKQTIEKERKMASVNFEEKIAGSVLHNRELSHLSQDTSDPSTGKDSASHRKVDKLKHVDRQESLSHENSMELTFQYLSSNLSTEWRDVGGRLGLEDATLNQIEVDNKPLKVAIHKMFVKWKQLNGDQATYKKLIQVLENKHVGRKDLAEALLYRKDLARTPDSYTG